MKQLFALCLTLKRPLLCLGLVALLLPAWAQQPPQSSALEEYQRFKEQALREYDDFRNQANADYLKFVEQAWKEYRAETAKPVPAKPEPPKQPVYTPDPQPQQPESTPQPFDEVVEIEPTVVQPAPVTPIPDPVAPVTHTIQFNLFGSTCSVRLTPGDLFRMRDASEASVGAMWRQLSDNRFNAMLQDCLHLRAKLQLCDWAYLQLLRRLAATCYATERSNEAIVLQAYILTQSGYKIRLARANGELTLLLPSRVEIYACKYVTMDDCNYYLLDQSFAGGSLQLCDFAFPGESYFSLYINKLPLFPVAGESCRSLTAGRYPDVQVSLCADKNLVDFYATFPQCRWDVHASAPLSRSVTESLYPVLRKAIEGKSEAEAANLLINFVQTAFDYQTDGAQFGYERPLFPDETIYYPYSDCEDRAILFSVLVRDLLRLDVVLVSYPDHLATAVEFGGTIPGDYFVIGNRRYLVCDPTYENAEIGCTMPGMNNSTAKIITLK